MAGWSGRSPQDNKRRLSRPVGCLLWLVALLVILIVAAVLFGGFQKGTKATGSPEPSAPAAMSLPRAPAT
jgi:hypothetical protein